MKSNEIVLPNFLIAGAGKCGTTYLAEALGLHPDVFIPHTKEPAFFSRYRGIGVYDRGMGFYQRSFVDYNDEPFVGEASTVYMYDPDSPGLIKRHVPDVKLIFIMRNPIERVYSNYWQDIQGGRKLRGFRELMLDADERIREMIYVSRYDIHLSRYYEHFPSSQILPLLFDDLVADRDALLNGILGFLGLSPFPEGTDLDFRSNPSSLPKSRVLARILLNRALLRSVKAAVPQALIIPVKRLLDSLRAANQKAFTYPPMDDESWEFLAEEFRDTVNELSRILGRDLSRWLARRGQA